ncbi:MAG TPA: 16S rRNA (guanine(966)-N(2))-methyltransferase RsmD [Polyangiaceae bacterium]|nr:16S rRNA (guanine(966)-N(2))-methyltransferase RsmD [Polyangiaceae bacterium]
MRIIAGSLRGRRLVAPPGLATRPTTDRVREAWFSMLGPLEGTALDLYAGTGALGFEALSRGAEHVVMVESGKAAQKAILQNADALGVRQRVTLLGSTVETCRSAVGRLAPFELILTDPPWTHIDEAERALALLLNAKLLTPTGRLVLGHPKKRSVSLRDDSGLVATKSRNWGDSAATFYEPAAEDPAAPSADSPADPTSDPTANPDGQLGGDSDQP